MLLVLRRKLGAYALHVLVNDGSAVALKLDAIDIDLQRFEAGIRSGDEAVLTSACSLWRGEFCEGLDLGAEGFDEWLALQRARLDESAIDAFRRLT
jgi:DNA-binding SARP family transcriptional activator